MFKERTNCTSSVRFCVLWCVKQTLSASLNYVGSYEEDRQTEKMSAKIDISHFGTWLFAFFLQILMWSWKNPSFFRVPSWLKLNVLSVCRFFIEFHRTQDISNSQEHTKCALFVWLFEFVCSRPVFCWPKNFADDLSRVLMYHSEWSGLDGWINQIILYYFMLRTSEFFDGFRKGFFSVANASIIDSSYFLLLIGESSYSLLHSFPSFLALDYTNRLV